MLTPTLTLVRSVGRCGWHTEIPPEDAGRARLSVQVSQFYGATSFAANTPISSHVPNIQGSVAADLSNA
jgi:hypothetical protein